MTSVDQACCSMLHGSTSMLPTALGRQESQEPDFVLGVCPHSKGKEGKESV